MHVSSRLQLQAPPTSKLMLGIVAAGASLAVGAWLAFFELDFLRVTFGFKAFYRELIGINLMLWSLAALTWLCCLLMRAKGYNAAWGLFGASAVGALGIMMYPAREPDPFEKPRLFQWSGGQHLLSTFILFILIWAAFWNSFKYSGWVLDNLYIIKYDPRHRAESWLDDKGAGVPGVKQIFVQDYWWPKGISGLFRPITTFTYWLNYTFFGNHTDTTYFHVVNFYLHWANAALVYALAYTLIRKWPMALSAAAIFAVHPITVESVTNIIGRADEFAAVVVLLGLLLWIRADRAAGWWKLAPYILIMLATTFGVFAKESSLAIGLVIIAYDLTYRWSPRFTRFFAMTVTIIVLTLFVGLCITNLPRPNAGSARNIISLIPFIAAGVIILAALYRLMTAQVLWQDSAQLWELRWTIACYTACFVALLTLPYLSGVVFARFEVFDKLSIGQRYARAGIVGGIAIAVYLALHRTPAPARLVALVVAMIGAIVASAYIRWFGLATAFCIGLIELIVQPAAPIRLAASDAWRSLRQRFVTGYFLLLPPALAMYFVRAWVFANSTPPETPFLDNPLRGGPFDPLSFWQSRMTAIKVIGKLIYLLFWPVHLSSDYSYDEIPLFTLNLINVENLKALVALGFIIGCFLAAAYYYRRDKALSFFILFFFAALFPTSNLAMLIGSIMAERFMYLPLIGFAGAIVIVGWKFLRWILQRRPESDSSFARHWRLAYVAAPAVVITLFAARTCVRNFDWFSDRTLWSAARDVSPRSFRCYQSLAFAIFEELPQPRAGIPVGSFIRERIKEMINIGEGALPIVGNLPIEWNSSRLFLHLGMYYTIMGDTLATLLPNGDYALNEQSRPWYQKGVRILQESSRVDRAFNEVNRRRQIERGDKPPEIFDVGLSPVYAALSTAYTKLGMHREAINTLRYQIHLEPLTDPEPLYRLASNYVKMQKYDDAAMSLIQCLLADPHRVDAWLLLSQIYDLAGQNGQGAILVSPGNEPRLNSQHPLVRTHLLDAYRDMIRILIRAKRMSQAEALREIAVNTYNFPRSVFDSLFTEEVPQVTPEGSVFQPPTKSK